MIDRDKVIRAVDSCFNYWLDQHRCLLPLELENVQQLKADAITLLKEQEPVKQNDGSCPNCGWNFENGDLDFSRLDSQKFYCPNCGQAVKWNDEC